MITQNRDSYSPNDVDILSKRLSVEDLISKIENNEINMLTGFQRKPDLWNITQKSRFIESILIRLPMPVVYFDGTNEENWLIIDGLQRLNTLADFILPDRNSFKLENLEYQNNLRITTFPPYLVTYSAVF